ncbi:MAG TPA: AroM family protein [Candidatus Sulfotelmatobacter sp.]|nr:AroM family protein [Candidatus Sulfotelmatobacter sp.]
MATRVGMITIGQSPRPDVVPEIVATVGRPMAVVEAGALDGLDHAAVRGLTPRPGDETLVTRMADATEVHVAKREIIPRLQSCIRRLSRDVDMIVVLCTGIFPEFHAPVPLLEPQRLLDRIVESVAGRGGHIGVMVPAAAQAEASRRKMEEYGLTATVAVASPYGRLDEIRRAGESFRDADVKAVVMHCIGYDAKMKTDVRQQCGKPVLLARSLVGKILEEML